jgi:hypothetical protein
MRVLESSTYRLVMQLRPVGLWLFGSFFVVAGVFPLLFAESTTLECSRGTGDCVLERSQLIGAGSDSFPISAIEEARLDISRGDDSTTYRVMVRTQVGDFPLTLSYTSNRQGNDRQVRQINNFLVDPSQTQLSISNDNWIWMFLIAAIFSGVGLMVILSMGRVVTCEFDKLAQSVKITRRGLLGETTILRPLQHIQTVTLETSHGSKGSTTYRVALGMSNGEAIPLTSYFSSGREEKWRTADRIARFLGVSPTLPLHGWRMPLNLPDLLRLGRSQPEARQDTTIRDRQTLDQNPLDSQARTNLIVSLWLDGKHEEAIALGEELKQMLGSQGQAAGVAQVDQLIAMLRSKTS